MDKGIEALIARKGNAVTGSYYLAECGACGEMFTSERMTGGEAIADTGDYGDCYCPHCDTDDSEIIDCGAVNSAVVEAWNFQQKHIDALIAALEQANRRSGYILEQSAEWERKAISNFEDCSEMSVRIVELESQRQLAFMACNRWRDKCVDAEKRIAEQEDKEIREDGNQFLVVRHAGKAPVIKHSAGDMADFLRQIIKHNPLVTIDIVKHRYYGVGGQYVQDADEYLRAAGGTVEGE